MKFVTFLTASMLAGITAFAQAGQHFSFLNPIADGSYANAMFETASLHPGNTAPFASFKNLFTGDTTLTVDNFSSTGDYIGSNSVSARYFLSKSGGATNDNFVGTITDQIYATGAGQIQFVDPNDSSHVYFQVAFSKSALSYGSFSAADTLTFSGSLFNTSETGNPNASFQFSDDYSGGGSVTHHTGTFAASIGTIGTVQSAPEPAPFAALATGALVFLRRRRR